MNVKLLKMVLKSLGRRRKEITRVWMAVFLSFMFITGILIFQDNMYNWQIASGKEYFGDWFLMESDNSGDESELLKQHPYLGGSQVVYNGAMILDSMGQETECNMGSMTDGFMELGNVKLEEGRLPENEEEIAMDWNTILKLRINPVIGEKVELYVRNEKLVKREYTLTGIISNYTGIWEGGNKLPGAIVTKKELENYSDIIYNVRIYPLKTYVKTDDYRQIFDSIDKKSQKQLYYNSDIYDFEPWGNEAVYDYMYILVMVIGIAAITYQITGYQNSREEYTYRLKFLGATRLQAKFATVIDSFVILIVSGVLGCAAAVVLGRLISSLIEKNTGILFYSLGDEVYVKVIIAMVIAVIFEEAAGAFLVKKMKGVMQRNEKITLKEPKKFIDTKNFKKLTSRRLIKVNGNFQNVVVRAFGLTMAVIMLVCVFNSLTAIQEYAKNNKSADVVGFKVGDVRKVYSIRYLQDKQDIYNDGLDDYTNVDKYYYLMLINNYSTPFVSLSDWNKIKNDRFLKDNDKKYQRYRIQQERLSKGVKAGNTYLSDGINSSIIDDIMNISGVAGVEYSYYESMRNWRWDNMDYTKMGIVNYYGSYDNSTAANAKYLYATEYVNATKELYGIISKYIDEDMRDYEAFANGEQVFVIEDVNTQNEYDDSMKPGINLELLYYDMPFYYSREALYKTDGIASYENAINNYINENLVSEEYVHGNNIAYFAYEHLTRNVSDEEIDALLKERGYDTDTITNKRMTYAQEKVDDSYYKFVSEQAATAKVAGVVRLSPEVKEELKEYINEYGQYTAIASDELAKKAIAAQNELLWETLKVDEDKDNIKFELEYNQLAITYDLSSTFSATGNVVCSYLGKSGFEYSSNSAEKDLLKAKTLEAILMYGITFAAAFVVYLIIGVILVRSRLERRRERINILIRTGADKRSVINIFMMESLRESLWCIFVAPITLIIHFLMYRRFISRL